MSLVSGSLAPEWRAWIVENLLLGRRPKTLVEQLVARGVNAEAAQTAVAEIDELPELHGAHSMARRLAALEQIVRLQRELGRRVEIKARIDLSADEFFGTYMAGHIPVLLPDFAANWPAIGKWDFGFFENQFGDVEVKLSENRGGQPFYERNSGRVASAHRLGDVIERIRNTDESDDFYLIAQNRNLSKPEFAPLFDDLRFDRGILDGERCKHACALWLGPAGTVTPMHHDTSAILFTQVHGRKRLRLIAPNETALLDRAHGLYAGVDPEKDWSDQPRLANVRQHVVELGPGETLFIPACWWHHARALSPSISLSFNGLEGWPNNFHWYLPGHRHKSGQDTA